MILHRTSSFATVSPKMLRIQNARRLMLHFPLFRFRRILAQALNQFVERSPFLICGTLEFLSDGFQFINHCRIGGNLSFLFSGFFRNVPVAEDGDKSDRCRKTADSALNIGSIRSCFHLL